jgi:hypothetical protein
MSPTPMCESLPRGGASPPRGSTHASSGPSTIQTRGPSESQSEAPCATWRCRGLRPWQRRLKSRISTVASSVPRPMTSVCGRKRRRALHIAGRTGPGVPVPPRRRRHIRHGNYLRLTQAHGFNHRLRLKPACNARCAPEYDALAAARRIYQWMADAWQRAGIPLD